MHIIVVGAGRIGRHVIEFATKEGHDVFVIEQDKKLAERISKSFDCKVINEDATTGEALNQAGAENADALITTTHDDAVNMLVMMVAKELEIKTLITSVAEESHMHLFDKMGVGTVESPDRLNAQHLYHAVKNPSVKNFLDLGEGVEIIEFKVKKSAKVTGMSIEELDKPKLLPEDARIVVIRRDENFIVPGHNTKLDEGDVVAVLARKEKIDQINALFEEQET